MAQRPSTTIGSGADMLHTRQVVRASFRISGAEPGRLSGRSTELLMILAVGATSRCSDFLEVLECGDELLSTRIQTG